MPLARGAVPQTKSIDKSNKSIVGEIRVFFLERWLGHVLLAIGTVWECRIAATQCSLLSPTPLLGGGGSSS